MAAGAAIEIFSLHHEYATAADPVVVLDDVTCSIPEGGYVALSGASGAGKSTLLSVIGGLEPPQGGEITVASTDLHGLGRNALARYRRDTVGFVFQHFGLLDTLTARENVELAMTLSRVPRGQRRERADELLAEVGLAHRLDQRAQHLSGGERQRVAIARSLANQPALVLADEPTGNLDEGSAEAVMALLERIRDERGCTLLVVTHSSVVAARAERRLRLFDGRVTEPGLAGGRR